MREIAFRMIEYKGELYFLAEDVAEAMVDLHEPRAAMQIRERMAQCQT